MPSIREAHPGEHVSGDRERQQRRPDIEVESVEPLGRRGHPSEGADPQSVKAEDQCGAGARAGQSHSPLHRVGEDGPEAQGQRVGPAARKRDLDRQR